KLLDPSVFLVTPCAIGYRRLGFPTLLTKTDSAAGAVLVEAEPSLNFITACFHSFRTASRGFLGYCQRNNDLGAYAADRIEQHVGDRWSAARHEALMKLIE